MSESVVVELGELAPKIPSVNPAKFPDEVFDLLSIPAYDAGAPQVVSGSEIGSNKQLVEPGDVMISKIVPHIRRVWVVPEPSAQGRRQLASSEWIVFRTDRVLNRWLRFYLLSDSFHAQFMNTVAGVGGSLLRARPQFVKKIKLAIPPVSQQEKEAEIEELKNTIQQKRERQQELFKELSYSYFEKIFILKELPKKPLGALIEGLEGGKSLVAKSQMGDSKYRVLKISAVTNENFSYSETKPLPTDYVPPNRHLVKNGDLLISRANTTEMVGSVAFVRGVEQNIALPDKLWKFIWKNPTEVLPEYIYFLLQTPEYRLKIQQLSSGSSGSMKNIPKSKLLKLDIPVPDFKQQLHFADLFQRLS